MPAIPEDFSSARRISWYEKQDIVRGLMAGLWAEPLQPNCSRTTSLAHRSGSPDSAVAGPILLPLAVTGGALNGGPNAGVGYGFAYVATNSWTNYSVQAQIRFSAANVYGGGLGGRVDATTGAHYAAWVYPEASLRLVQCFEDHPV